MSLIAVENLTPNYGRRTVLRNGSLTVELGEIITIVVPNGSG